MPLRTLHREVRSPELGQQRGRRVMTALVIIAGIVIGGAAGTVLGFGIAKIVTVIEDRIIERRRRRWEARS
jgi:hypothetical protein